jgi:hypothetical protein
MDPLDIGALGFSGHTLNVEERAGLEVAIAKKRLEEGLREVGFWGKLFGEEDDYLVVAGFGPSADFPRKRFYFRWVCTVLAPPGHGWQHARVRQWVRYTGSVYQR